MCALESLHASPQVYRSTVGRVRESRLQKLTLNGNIVSHAAVYASAPLSMRKVHAGGLDAARCKSVDARKSEGSADEARSALSLLRSLHIYFPRSPILTARLGTSRVSHRAFAEFYVMTRPLRSHTVRAENKVAPGSGVEMPRLGL